MRLRYGTAALLLAACAPRAQVPPNDASQVDSDRNERQKRVPFGDRCVGQPSPSGDGMLVACDGKQVMFIVPGTEWKVRTSPSDALGVAANAGAMNVSVEVADASATGDELSVHLESRYQDIRANQARMRAQLEAETLEVGPPSFEHETGHLILCYELKMSVPGGTLLRQVNVWTALRRTDRRYVDFHLSEVAPVDGSSGSDMKDRLVSLAGAFVVTDGAGNLPPQ
jgi:hypothetical protein